MVDIVSYKISLASVCERYKKIFQNIQKHNILEIFQNT